MPASLCHKKEEVIDRTEYGAYYVMTENGRIVKGIGGLYSVDTGNGILQCRARGKFRLEKITPMVGDEVTAEITGDGKGYILQIHTRKNSFVRPPVSNIDILIVVASAAEPVTRTILIDRMCAVAVNKEIEPVVLINKCDMDRGNNLYDIYSFAGIKVLRMSAVTGEGKAELLDTLEGKVAAFAGNSGVGKSSILNMVAPEHAAAVGAINERIGRGRHTTRHVELFKVGNKTFVADTPGFSSFDESAADIIEKEELEYTFSEFIEYIPQCVFTGCSHVNDKGCAVRAAAEDGKISRSRYENYIVMYNKAKEIKKWEIT